MTIETVPDRHLFDAASRSGVQVVMMYAMIGALLLLPQWPLARQVLGVGSHELAIALGVFGFFYGAVTLVFHASPRAWRRWRELLCTIEGLATQFCVLYPIFASGEVGSVFWVFYGVQIFQSAAEASRLWTAMVANYVGPAVLGVAFWLDNAGGAAAISWFIGAVGLSLFRYMFLYHRRLEQANSARVETERENAHLRLKLERQRISRDLHDGVGAELSSVLWQARQLARGMTDPEDRATVERFADGIGRGIDALRATVWPMRPIDRSWSELVRLLRDHLETTCHERVTLSFDAPESDERVPAPVCEHVASVVKEATRNALRHGKPTQLRVSLAPGPPVRIVAEDDGLGISPAALDRSEGGLANLRSRVEEAGGTCRITALGTGTRVEASLGA